MSRPGRSKHEYIIAVFVQYNAYTLGYSAAKPATFLHAMQYTYKSRSFQVPIYSLPSLLPHLQDTLDSRLEAQLEPSPPPLTVQTLPLRSASLVEPLGVEVPAHTIPAHLVFHILKCPGNVDASLIVHVDCPSQCRAEFHGRWLRHWRWATAGSGVE